MLENWTASLRTAARSLWRDRGEDATVAVVSETLARRLGRGASPIGARVRLQPAADAHDAGHGLGVLQVVGVARDVRQSPGDVDLADLYLPLLQQPGRFAFLQLRTAGPPAAWIPSVRTALGEIDANVAIDTARPLQVPLDELMAQPRFLALTLAGFALVAASLALVGVYGVISYAVRQREREIAVRLAVGASPQAITRLFLRQGGVVMTAGLALGLLGAAAAGRAIESQLFGVRPLEAHTLAVAVAGFAGAGLVAIWWPARRAAACDPSRALKEE